MKNLLTLAAILAFLSAVVFASCSNNDELDEDALIDKQKKTNEKSLNDYYLDSLDCGVYIYIKKDTVSAKGEIIGYTDSVTITYTAQSLQQKITIDSRQQARVLVSDLIPGLRKAIVGLPRNTEGRLIIPAEMAYGSRRVGKVEPNSTLYFDYFKVE